MLKYTINIEIVEIYAIEGISDANTKRETVTN
jgi:hypothetical protein